MHALNVSGSVAGEQGEQSWLQTPLSKGCAHVPSSPPHSCKSCCFLGACLLPPGVVGVELPERQQAALVLLVCIHDVVPVLRSSECEIV